MRRLLIIAAAGLLLAAATRRPGGQVVRIGYLPIAASLPLYVALDRKMFEAEGLAPRVTRYGSSDELGHAGTSGKADVMSSLALNVAFDLGRRTGVPFRLFCANTYSNRPGETVDHLMVRKGSGIARAEDLKGKRVAAFPGSVSRILFLGMLGKHGLGEHDVAYTELPPKKWEAALAAGDVDAAFVMEPEATEIADRGVATVLVSGVIAEFFPDAPLSGHWVTGPAGAKLGARVARAYRRALELIRADPAAARLSYARHTQVPGSVAARMPLMHWTAEPAELPGAVQRFADFLLERQAIAERVDASRYVLQGP